LILYINLYPLIIGTRELSVSGLFFPVILHGNKMRVLQFVPGPDQGLKIFIVFFINNELLISSVGLGIVHKLATIVAG
jgi:hypothetical protein